MGKQIISGFSDSFGRPVLIIDRYQLKSSSALRCLNKGRA